MFDPFYGRNTSGLVGVALGLPFILIGCMLVYLIIFPQDATSGSLDPSASQVPQATESLLENPFPNDLKQGDVLKATKNIIMFVEPNNTRGMCTIGQGEYVHVEETLGEYVKVTLYKLFPIDCTGWITLEGVSKVVN